MWLKREGINITDWMFPAPPREQMLRIFVRTILQITSRTKSSFPLDSLLPQIMELTAEVCWAPIYQVSRGQHSKLRIKALPAPTENSPSAQDGVHHPRLQQ